MKALVLGSGVIGITTAWYLAEAGYEVTVVDRQANPGMETSFSNGGQISWGSATPWAAPHTPMLALKWLFKPHAPLILRPRFDPAMWSWLFRMLRECTHERFVINRQRMVRMSRYSHDCLVLLRSQTGIQYDQSSGGLLTVYREQANLDEGAHDAHVLDALGIPFRILDRAQCIAQEPGLADVAHKIVGGIHYPEDECGDCIKFTQALAILGQKRGVRLTMSTTIERLLVAGDRLEGVQTNRGRLDADVYVLACGSYSPLLLRPHGIDLPVYPIKGYSMTVPVVDAASAPRSTVTDDRHKVVMTRLGDRVRIAGIAELAGYDLVPRAARFEAQEFVMRDLFPRAGDFARAERWCGLRPMTPDNPPVVSATLYKNLFLNTGHGTQGWTMACGSGKFMADLISGKHPDISAQDYALQRFG